MLRHTSTVVGSSDAPMAAYQIAVVASAVAALTMPNAKPAPV
jgi:hypothetical protein